MTHENILSKEPTLPRMICVNVGVVERMASVVAGAALAAYGIRRSSVAGYGVAAAASALLFRGLTGFCPVNEAVGRDSSTSDRRRRRVEIRTNLTVGKPRDEVYAYWRRLENLPRFMRHVSEVRQEGARRSQWTAPIRGTDANLRWDAEIQAENENVRLAWHSIEGSSIQNSGEIRFEDAPGGRGTVLNVHLSYVPPAGAAGEAAAGLVNPAFEQMVKEDVRRFKQVIETGEVPSTEGQPSGVR